MAYTVFQHDTDFGLRKGLEDPFHYPSGAVLYYDHKERKYYDPRTDLYVRNEDVAILQQQVFDRLTQKSH